ncbi:dihydroxyacetone kinase [Ascodesmis nigricans]|uniref:Dihydroxyacetone kinase n=1 Tax=Ascodesmis nigricans TaxID=341454 RepID=A0A4S2MPM4_9PEZI|nr:dihydroxyacetone kinase [Ascodesmis nigricans]
MSEFAEDQHFINDPTQLVNTALRAATSTNPSLALDPAHKIVYRKQGSPNEVALVSGGGAGHEPAFVGFVGSGILRAAVTGTIFASPSVKQIYHCIADRASPNKGVLLIVMNYTGDVLHFGLATEKARAQGLNVEMVVVGDDVGVGRAKSGKVGRRGIAGTILVSKIAGALAATGARLQQTAALARLVAANLVSMGSSLAHVHVPGTAVGDTGLKMGEIELGMGIHNEQGSKRMSTPTLDGLVGIMLGNLLSSGDSDRAYLDPGEPARGWVVMVNNLGGVSPLEMGGITAEVLNHLDSNWNIKPKRVYSGTFMTSLNGNGFSISLLKLVDTGLGPGKSMLELLDAHHETVAWNSSISPSTWESDDVDTTTTPGESEEIYSSSELQMEQESFIRILSSGLQSIITAETEITKYDQIVGDGDCGTGLRRGAEAVLDFLSTPGNVTSDCVKTIAKIADVVEGSMDGTSGALYSIFLNALAKGLRDSGATHADGNVWAKAANDAMAGLGRYTPAQPGDRTMIDALQPFVSHLMASKDLREAAKAARSGAEKTKGMAPRLGRTVYIDEIGQVPDPGAVGIAVLAEGMARGVKVGGV